MSSYSVEYNNITFNYRNTPGLSEKAYNEIRKFYKLILGNNTE